MFQKIKFLVQSLNQPKDFKFLFRASDYNFSSGTFHDVCDSIPDTITLLRTEHGKTIAGYTHYPWGKAENSDGLDDRKKLAFLLQLDNQEKLIPVSKENLIYHDLKLGPVFGSGYDLCISDQCNTNNHSCASIPTGYNYEGGHTVYESVEESRKAFSGADNFRVEEYEVYQVQYY